QLLKHETGERVSTIRSDMQVAMEKHVGIFRDEDTLKESCREVGELKQRLRKGIVEDKDHVYNTELVAALELDFMLDVAETIPYSAVARQESRGAHYRDRKSTRLNSSHQ